MWTGYKLAGGQGKLLLCIVPRPEKHPGLQLICTPYVPNQSLCADSGGRVCPVCKSNVQQSFVRQPTGMCLECVLKSGDIVLVIRTFWTRSKIHSVGEILRITVGLTEDVLGKTKLVTSAQAMCVLYQQVSMMTTFVFAGPNANEGWPSHCTSLKAVYAFAIKGGTHHNTSCLAFAHS